MAELTPIEETLGEVIGLAQAGQQAADKVLKLLEEEDGVDQLTSTLERMRKEAEQTQQQAEAVASSREGKKTAILDMARETKQEAVEMMQTYLGEDADALDGFEFLIMSEAGELGHVEVAGTMARTIDDTEIRQLVEQALPIQQRHFEQVREGALTLAAQEAEEG